MRERTNLKLQSKGGHIHSQTKTNPINSKTKKEKEKKRNKRKVRKNQRKQKKEKRRKRAKKEPKRNKEVLKTTSKSSMKKKICFDYEQQ